MGTPVTTVTKTLEYKVPNEKYGTSDSDGNTCTATYVGPDQVWVFVDEDGDSKGKRNRTMTELTTRDDGADVPLPEGCVRAKLDASKTPDLLILCITAPTGATITTSDQGETTETYGDYTVKYNSKLEVQETYVTQDQCVYDIDNEVWLTPAYKTADRTWDMVIENRDAALEASDGKISPDMPDAVKAPWVTYRQALRDLPAVFKKGESDEVPAWKVQLPFAPDTIVE